MSPAGESLVLGAVGAAWMVGLAALAVSAMSVSGPDGEICSCEAERTPIDDDADCVGFCDCCAGCTHRDVCTLPLWSEPGAEAVRIATAALGGEALGSFRFPIPVKADHTGRFRPRPTASQLKLGYLVINGGGLAKGTLRRVLNNGAGALKRCYERDQVYHPTTDVTVTIRFVVTASGSVQSATGDGDTQLATCAADALAHLRFPRSDRLVAVVVPLDFSPARRP